VQGSDRVSVLRTDDGGEQQVTPLELFFDLVYVFAVTQLSHLLLEQPTVGGALETLFLVLVVWWAWMYTMLWPKYTRIWADKVFNPPFWER
jgi:low temperature requirement protein LtrA